MVEGDSFLLSVRTLGIMVPPSEVAVPLVGEEGILYADIDPQIAIEERQTLDCSGHYARSDVLHLDPRRNRD